MAAVEKSKDKKYSKEEYFIMEEKATEKHEFHDGEILMMSGASANHNMICANAVLTIGGLLKKKGCKLFTSDMKIELEKYNQFVYPDFSVVCGDIDFSKDRKDIIKNPFLIVEVLSDSTEAYDRGTKFVKYWSLDSLKEYILISQHTRQIDVFSRQEEKIWRMASYDDGKIAKLVNAELEFSVDEIYDGIL